MTDLPATERTLNDVLEELNDLQLTFVLHRMNCRFDTEAAELAGCHPKTKQYV